MSNKTSYGFLNGCPNGPLARYVNLRVAHAPGIPGIPGTFSPPPRVSDPDMHHGTCVTHVPWCMSGSLTSGFLRSRWRGKRSRHSRRNPQFYVSGKRPITTIWLEYPLYFVRKICSTSLKSRRCFTTHEELPKWVFVVFFLVRLETKKIKLWYI